MKSTASVFFEELIAKGVQGVKALIGTSETEWLDFKTQAKHPNDDKSTWSEAISGFANNQGGVLIWGVDARKDSASGIDAANALVPIKSVDVFQSRLRELTHVATEPPLPGIIVKSMYDESEATLFASYRKAPQSRTARNSRQTSRT